MKTLNKYVEEQMKNEDFKTAYDKQKQEMELELKFVPKHGKELTTH